MMRSQRVGARSNRRLWLLVAMAGLGVILLVAYGPSGGPAVGGPDIAPLFRLAGGGGVPGNPHGPITLSCEACHTSEGWTPLRPDPQFDHARQTRFPLMGRHTAASCRSCHLDLVFTEPRLMGDACATCHVDVHQTQLGPNCATCHNTTDFGLVNVETVHARTAFPLTGMHRAVSCASCHHDATDGRFAAVDAGCLSCHAQEFARAVPDHHASGFGTTCESCHGTVTWRGARFDHEHLFPLLTGSHAREWTSCQSCHLQPGSFEVFSCVHCHAHRRDRMDDKHDDVPGYVYESNACLSCHPTGEEL